jgi:hypothetical protein
MKQVARDKIVTALEDAGLDADDGVIREEYSGRGMYGQTCFALTLDYWSEFALFLVEFAKAEGDQSDIAQELAQNFSSDSMGHGMVFYFRGWELAD